MFQMHLRPFSNLPQVTDVCQSEIKRITSCDLKYFLRLSLYFSTHHNNPINSQWIKLVCKVDFEPIKWFLKTVDVQNLDGG